MLTYQEVYYHDSIDLFLWWSWWCDRRVGHVVTGVYLCGGMDNRSVGGGDTDGGADVAGRGLGTGVAGPEQRHQATTPSGD